LRVLLGPGLGGQGLRAEGRVRRGKARACGAPEAGGAKGRKMGPGLDQSPQDEALIGQVYRPGYIFPLYSLKESINRRNESGLYFSKPS
jgi:hypothetical protein